MPHTRERYLSLTLRKSLRFWPVVCLLGARQVGKSTLLKRLPGYDYSTLDDPGLNELALRNPRGLLNPPCVIDEAQKVPSLFDAVKRDVDEQKAPGKFILTGSVRFSKRTLIRESLTGRAKQLQLLPFTCAEALELPFEDRWTNPTVQKSKLRVSRKELQRSLTRGGMPGAFAIRNGSESQSYWKTLIDSYVYRDLLFAIPRNAKPAVALKILSSIAEILALGETPTFSRILRKTGGARTLIERHILGLEDLMILNRVPHLGASPAKDLFLPFDPALFLSLLNLEDSQTDVAVHLGCLQIRMLNEFLVARNTTDSARPYFYARSPQGHLLHLIVKNKSGSHTFFQLHEEPVPHDYSLRFLRAQATKWKGTAIALTSISKPHPLTGIHLLPWEQVL